jgi:PadR family transcriptional regulator PadR
MTRPRMRSLSGVMGRYMLIIRDMRRKAGALVPLESCLLAAALQLQRRRVHRFYGYQIAKHLADVSDRRLLTAYGTLYRALGRLEQMGLLESHWEDPQIAADENRPGRRLYTLTEEGIAAARESRPSAVISRGRRVRSRRVAPA